MTRTRLAGLERTAQIRFTASGTRQPASSKCSEHLEKALAEEHGIRLPESNKSHVGDSLHATACAQPDCVVATTAVRCFLFITSWFEAGVARGARIRWLTGHPCMQHGRLSSQMVWSARPFALASPAPLHSAVSYTHCLNVTILECYAHLHTYEIPSHSSDARRSARAPWTPANLLHRHSNARQTDI